MAWLTDLLKEYPALNVARERIALAEQRYNHSNVKTKCSSKKPLAQERELESLRRQVPSTEWVEARGVSFKRRGDGTFEPDAYCPECKRAMNALSSFMPLLCSKCEYVAPVQTSLLAEIVAGLPAT